MINMFRTVLFNIDPVVANALSAVDGYMIVDPDYIVKPFNSLNQQVHTALFVNTVTDTDKTQRATTIYKIVRSSMLQPVITDYDKRLTGASSVSEVSTDVIKEIVDALKALPIDSTSSLFIGTQDKETFAEHAFFRQEPIEIISGFAAAIVDDVIITRKLQWL